MGIPESQLETWAHQGAVTTARATHVSIRNALRADNSPIKNKDFEVYIQGSYKNSTNIRGDSDVDVITQLNSSFRRDLTALSNDERTLYKQAHSDATYLWKDFRADVMQALQSYYSSSSISEGDKSLKVAGGSGRLPADVVVCLQYRKYLRFQSLDDQQYVEGIAFYALREGRWIINFPKPHYNNGVNKNSQSRTNGWYKPTVRCFKNARTYLVENREIDETLAPSYFLECLIYNVPDAKFGINYQNTFVNVINWLAEADFNDLVCQNEQLLLFGSIPEQWSIENANGLIQNLVRLWNNW